MVALVDEEDFPLVAGKPWRPFKSGKTFYAAYTKRIGGRRVNVFMHRLILGSPPGGKTDHVDGNGLNNLRGNLRWPRKGGNEQNSRLYQNNSSGYRGVGSELRCKNRWYAKINVDGRRHRIGSFGTPEEAACAYDEAARRLHGPYARLNFPQPGERSVRPIEIVAEGRTG